WITALGVPKGVPATPMTITPPPANFERLFLTKEFTRVMAPVFTWIPPPLPMLEPQPETLFWIVVLRKVGREKLTRMPPPRRAAVLLSKVQVSKTALEPVRMAPPPSTAPKFPRNETFTKDGEELVTVKPPPAPPNALDTPATASDSMRMAPGELLMLM